METDQLIQAAASVAGGMAAVHYGKFSGLEASRITEIAETAVKIVRAIEIEARKHQK
jgi:Tfp pilus assembly protein PilP